MLEQRSRETRLPDDRKQRSDPDLGVIRHRHRHRSLGRALLHDHVASSLADLSETVLGQESADLLTRKVLNLPNRDLKTRHEHLGGQAGLDLGLGSGFKEQLQRFD